MSVGVKAVGVQVIMPEGVGTSCIETIQIE